VRQPIPHTERGRSSGVEGEVGSPVTIASLPKKKLQFVAHDFVEGYDTYTEKPGYTW
jgi:hypothetical protein